MLILYVEPELELREQMDRYLASYGLSVIQADDLRESAAVLSARHVDAIVLASDADRSLGVVQGLHKRLSIPLVVTSPSCTDTERVLLIEAGADYILPKPFSPRELVACLRGIQRRALAQGPRPAPRRIAHCGGWRIDLTAHTADIGSQRVAFTSGEAGVLRVLLDRPLRLCSRADLVAATRRNETEITSRTVDVLVSRIRQKLEAADARLSLIETVRGEGYRLAQPVVWESGEAARELDRNSSGGPEGVGDTTA